MSSVTCIEPGPVSTITLARGKVNALDDASVRELNAHFESLAGDAHTRAVVLTGQGSFFSFGLDVPALYDYSPEEFTRFLDRFTRLYLRIFEFPKPVIAAINGHAIAGGLMLVTPCDYRVMAVGKARISLNEVTFGSSLFAGSLEILRGVVGHRNAERVALGGQMYSAEEAKALGLVDEVAAPVDVLRRAAEVATRMADPDPAAYAAIKHLLRDTTAARIRAEETSSIRRFVEIWYSPTTQEQLRRIQIRAS